MFTTIAWSEEIDPAGVFANLTAVPDPHVTTQGDSIYVPEFANQLLMAEANIGTTGTNARIRAPSLEGKNPLYLRPVNLGLYNDGLSHIAKYLNGGHAFQPNEGIKVEVEANPAAAEYESIVMFLCDSIPNQVQGNMFTIEATITLALAAGLWQFSELTLVHDLPNGNFTVVGLRIVAASGVVARFIHGNIKHRPGAPCQTGLENEDYLNPFRCGRLGEWFTFDNRNLPGLEVLGSAAVASATYDVHIDLIMR